MAWTGWLVIGTILVCLYVLATVIYRLALSVRALIAEVKKTQGLINELKNISPIAVRPAIATTGDDLAKVLIERRAIERKREHRARERQRRLVQRISDIEMDKR